MEKEQIKITELRDSEQAEVEQVEVEEVQEPQQIDLDLVNQNLDKIKQDQNKIALDLGLRQKELFQKEIKFALKEHDLEAFADVIKVNDSKELEETINQLKTIVNQIKVANSYQPKEKATQDAFSVAQQNGDTKKMIGSKLANFFKN